LILAPRLLGFICFAVLVLAGCSGESSGAPSGRYVAELADSELGTGLKMHLEFKSDGTAVLEMEEDGRRIPFLDCTYTSGEVRIALSCLGSSGISLTRLQGGDLEGDLDGAILRYRKQ